MIEFVHGSDVAPPDQRRDRLRDLPPSAKLVFKVLQYEAPLTQQGICEQSRLPARTVRYALSKLDDAGLVTERIHLPDARKRIYHPVSLAPETD